MSRRHSTRAVEDREAIEASVTSVHLADVLARDLRTIADLWPDLLRRTKGAGTRLHMAPAATRPPESAYVLEHRDETSRTLTSWARLVIEERELSVAPESTDGDVLARWLAVHAEWCAEQEWGTEMAREVAAAAEQTDRIAHPLKVGVHIGTCPREMGEGVACDTPVRAGDRDQPIRCRGCGHEDSMEGWLGVMGVDDGPRSPEAMSDLLHDRMGVRVPPTTLRRLAEGGSIYATRDPMRIDTFAAMAWVAYRDAIV